MKILDWVFNLRHKEIFIFAFLVLLFFVFSYGPIIQNFKNAPPGRYYWGGIEYPIDNVGSLSVVREGMLGHWQMQYKFSSAMITKPGFVKIEYIAVGQIARLFHLDIIVAYFLTRFLLSIANIFLIYFLVNKLFKSPFQRMVGYFLAIFSAGVTLPFDFSRVISNKLPQDVGVFLRITTAAHHYQLGIFFGLLAIYFLSKYIVQANKLIYFIIACISGIITTIVYAPTAILIWMSLPVVFLFEFYHLIRNKMSKRHLTQLVLIFAVFIFITVFPLLYVRYLSGYWDDYSFSRTENIVPFAPLWWHYFFIAGLTYFFSLFAIPEVVKKRNVLFSFFLAWVVVHPVAMNWIAPIIGLNKTRFFLTPYFVIFGILAVFGIEKLLSYIKKAIAVRFNQAIAYLICVLLVVISGFETYKISLDWLRACFCQGDGFAFGYPRNEDMSAWKWLRDNSREDDIILSDNFAGMMIPVFAGNKVYTSHWVNIVWPSNFNEIVTNKERFFSGYMPDEEAKQFLLQNQISYIYYGTIEKWPAGKLSYPFIEKKYSNPIVDIYKVTN